MRGDMERRKFLKCVAALPLLFVGRDAQSAREPLPSQAKRDILLLDTMIAGWQYHRGDRIWHSLKNHAPLTLCREPQNSHDEMAVAVYAAGVKLGYVPRANNSVIAHMMDQRVRLHASVLWKNANAQPWERLAMRITMEAPRDDKSGNG